jgi:hypothetical protein
MPRTGLLVCRYQSGRFDPTSARSTQSTRISHWNEIIRIAGRIPDMANASTGFHRYTVCQTLRTPIVWQGKLYKFPQLLSNRENHQVRDFRRALQMHGLHQGNKLCHTLLDWLIDWLIVSLCSLLRATRESSLPIIACNITDMAQWKQRRAYWKPGNN